MGLSRFQEIVRSTDELPPLLGSPSALALQKQLTELDGHMQAFVARAPFALLGTIGTDGKCDVSPRGDWPAVAAVLDAQTLILPDRPGNRRADSLRNIIETGKIGLLFLVPGIGETLRINGRACVCRDAQYLSALAVNNKPPILGIGVEVEECYFQCAKALIRSKLWQGTSQDAAPTEFDFAKVLVEETCLVDQTIDSLKQQIETSYKERLY